MKLALGSLAFVLALAACATGQMSFEDEDENPPTTDGSRTLPGAGGDRAEDGRADESNGSPDGAPPKAGSDGGSDGALVAADANDGGNFTMTTQTIQESASSGTPDSYTYNVQPGDPITASVTGGGSGSWGINASNGTSAGQYCFGASTCAFTVPVGVTAIMITVVTTDIGYYQLTVTRPVH